MNEIKEEHVCENKKCTCDKDVNNVETSSTSLSWDSTDVHSTPSNNIPKAQPVTKRNKIGRNDLCGCGSGKKYKKCCLGNGIV